MGIETTMALLDPSGLEPTLLMFKRFVRAALALKPHESQTEDRLFLHPQKFLEQLEALNVHTPSPTQIANAVSEAWEQVLEHAETSKTSIHYITLNLDRTELTLVFCTRLERVIELVWDITEKECKLSLSTEGSNITSNVKAAEAVSTGRVWRFIGNNAPSIAKGLNAASKPVLFTPIGAMQYIRSH